MTRLIDGAAERTFSSDSSRNSVALISREVRSSSLIGADRRRRARLIDGVGGASSSLRGSTVPPPSRVRPR